MNWLINAIAALVVVVLGALAFGPHLVDWNQFRDSIAASASDVLGATVTIAGDVDVALLPSPRLVLAGVAVGPAEAPLMTAERVELDVSLTPLLSREVHVNDLTLTRPTLTLRVDRRGGIALPVRTAPGTLADFLRTGRVSVGNVAASDLTAVVFDERTGVRRTLTGIDVSGSARSLAGPFSASGWVPFGEGRAAVTVQGGTLSGGTLPLSLRANLDGTRSIGFEGTLTPDPAAPLLLGQVRLEGTGEMPFAVEGALSLDPSMLTVADAAATWGSSAVPLDVTGRASLDLAEREPLALRVEARQLDLDRIERAIAAPGDAPLAEGPAAPSAPPSARPPAEAFARLGAAFAPALATLQALPAWGIAINAELDLNTVLAGGAVVRDVSAQVATGASGFTVSHAEALFPGDALVEASGRLAGGGFAGHVKVNAPQPQVFSRWWRGGAAGTVVEPLLGEADVDASATAVNVRRLSLRLGESAADGRIRWTRDNGGTLDVSLDAPLLDLAEVAAAASLARGLPAAGSVRIDLAADHVRLGEEGGDGILARAEFSGGTLRVASLAAERFAGARLFASGAIADLFGVPSGRIEGTLALDDGRALGSALSRALPGRAGALARRIAPALTPGELKLALSGGSAGELELSLSGAANGTTLSVEAAGSPLTAARTSLPAHLAVALENPDARVLMRQLGFPGGEDGAGRLALKADGVPAEGMAATASLTLPEGHLSYAGNVRLAEAASLSGRVEGASARLDAVGAALGVRLPVVAVSLRAQASGGPERLALADLEGTVDGASVSGDLALADRLTGRIAADSADLGRLAEVILGPGSITPGAGGDWPTTPFTVPAVPVAVEVALSAGRLVAGGIGVEDARADLVLAPDRFSLSGLSGALAGGRLTGALEILREGGRAELSARAEIADARLAELAWASGGAPVAGGTMRLDASLASSAFTTSGLVQGLAGSGQVAIAGGTLAINPAPFDLPAEALEGDAAEAFTRHLDAGSLAFDRLTGRLEVAGGRVALADVAISPGSALGVAEATLDLDAKAVRARVTLPSVLAGSEVAPLAITFAGPLAAPRRTIDAAALATFVDLRRLALQVEVVERDNRALAAEADARGAPSDETLRRLGVPAPAEAPAAPAPPPFRMDENADADPQAGAARTDGLVSPVPQASPPRMNGAVAPAPGPAADGAAAPDPSATPAASQPDVVEGFIRSLQALDGAMSEYEATRARGLRAEDELRSRLGIPVPAPAPGR